MRQLLFHMQKSGFHMTWFILFLDKITYEEPALCINEQQKFMSATVQSDQHVFVFCPDDRDGIFNIPIVSCGVFIIKDG